MRMYAEQTATMRQGGQCDRIQPHRQHPFDVSSCLRIHRTGSGGLSLRNIMGPRIKVKMSRMTIPRPLISRIKPLARAPCRGFLKYGMPMRSRLRLSRSATRAVERLPRSQHRSPCPLFHRPFNGLLQTRSTSPTLRHHPWRPSGAMCIARWRRMSQSSNLHQDLVRDGLQVLKGLANASSLIMIAKTNMCRSEGSIG